MSRGKLILAIGCMFSSVSPVMSFTGTFQRLNSIQLATKSHRSERNGSISPRPSTRLSMANFDLSKPTFDLFSLRTVRNDALLQYSSLNQSEPLRINLYLILAVSLFSFPTLSEAVIGEEAQLTSVVLSTLAGFGSVGLFLKECGKRAKQLNRIEKEMNAEFLKVKLSTKNKFDGAIYGNQPTVSLKDLRGKRRVLAICGPTDALKDALVQFRAFRRRLVQSGALIAVVPTDVDVASGAVDWKKLGIKDSEIRSGQWFGQVQNPADWLDYFQGLVNEDSPKDNLIWFGLNYNGRSFASASGEAPRLLEILGQNLRPIDLLDESDEAESTLGFNPTDVEEINDILGKQEAFYNALTMGDLEGMRQICAGNKAKEVSEIIDVGGRIDSWESCLAEGARPAGMKTSGFDVLLKSSSEAYSTCIEFPENVGGYNDPSGATLLAMQRWTRDGEGQDWNLDFHQTIPWSIDTRAGGTLRCDCRGCVALTRGPEKRTFGGVIG